MSRNQFVRNTLSAIQMQLHPNGSSSDFDSSSGRQGSDYTGGTPGKRVKRSDSMTSWSSLSKDPLSPQVNESTASFQASNNEQKENGPAPLYDRNWENEMETMLKVSLATTRLLVPRLNENAGNVYRHQKQSGSATPGRFRAVIHFFPLTSRDVVAQSQHPRAIRSLDGFQEGQYKRVEFHTRSSQWRQPLQQ